MITLIGITLGVFLIIVSLLCIPEIKNMAERVLRFVQVLSLFSLGIELIVYGVIC